MPPRLGLPAFQLTHTHNPCCQISIREPIRSLPSPRTTGQSHPARCVVAPPSVEPSNLTLSDRPVKGKNEDSPTPSVAAFIRWRAIDCISLPAPRQRGGAKSGGDGNAPAACAGARVSDRDRTGDLQSHNLAL